MNKSSTSNAEHYKWGENCDGWHLLKRDDVSVIQELVPPGQVETNHLHNVSRQFFYILAGTGTMRIGEETIILSSGEGLEIPPGTAHQFRNDSGEDVSFLVISAPKSHGDRINLD